MDYNKNDLNVSDILHKIIRYWWIVALFSIFISGTFYYISAYKTIPLYQAHATIFIGRDVTVDATLSIAELNVGDKLVGDYTELIRSDLVLDTVISELGLQTTAGGLSSMLQIQATKESRFLYLTVVDSDPVRAATIANKVADTLLIKAQEIVGTKNITIVDYAKAPSSPFSPNVTRNTVVACFAGFVVSTVLVLVFVVVRNTIEKEEDIESIVGLTVIGTIPKFKGGSRNG